MINRRRLLTGLVSLIAAPAIVPASSLDLVRGIKLTDFNGWVDEFRIDGLWHHIAITRKNTVIKMFVDGKRYYGFAPPGEVVYEPIDNKPFTLDYFAKMPKAGGWLIDELRVKESAHG